MELSDYDADLMDILSPAELSPLPNEPPPPPYMSGRLPVKYASIAALCLCVWSGI